MKIGTQYVMENSSLTIQDYGILCPGTHRRSLQRDLKAMMDHGVLVEKGTGPTDPARRYTLKEKARI